MNGKPKQQTTDCELAFLLNKIACLPGKGVVE